MNDAYIVSAVRTPLGRFGGILSGFTPPELGSFAMKAALEKAGISGESLDLYIMGNVLRAGHGQLLPKQAALKAGIPDHMGGYALEMVCSSGMLALMNAATLIKAGEADLVLAGGMECMSQTGFYLSQRARWGYKFLLGAPEQVVDLLLYDGLTDPVTGVGMGEETEQLAAKHGFTREALDEVSALSQQRAAAATEKGAFKAEIAPVEVKVKKDLKLVDYDEGIRGDTTLESLAKLRPAFTKDGVLTAGNCSQISDGAAALVIASQAAIDKYGLKPLAKITGNGYSGGETWRFPEYPVYASQKLLEKLGKTVNDIDLFENNEAFSVSNLLFENVLKVPREKLNVNGGAIALGHPIGASGARIVVTLLHALIAQDKALGLAALCHGTGGGTALAIERV
jgi:acetyl-CoA C-acetyltransferase